MPDAPPPFDRNHFRAEVQKKLEGLSRETVILIASRCAWRAVPVLFSTPGNKNWWQKHGAGVQAALILSLLRGCGKTISDPSDAAAADAAADAAAAAADAAYAAYAAADAASDAASAAAAAYAAAAYAADAAAYAADAAYAAYAADAAAAAADAADACRRDLQLARDSSYRLIRSPLWFPETMPEGRLKRWWISVDETMGSREDVGSLYRWLKAVARGEPPLDEMDQWLREWQQRNFEKPGPASRQAKESSGRETASKSKRKAPAKKASQVSAQRESAQEPERGQESKIQTPLGIIAETLESQQKKRALNESLPVKAKEEPEQIHTTYLAKVTDSLLADSEAPELTKTAQECAAALHTFLASPDTQPPLTVSVEAPWGGGKSSLLRYLQKRLEGKVPSAAGVGKAPLEPIATVWFNPWKHEAGKTLWAAFAVAFERQLRDVRRPCRTGRWWSVPIHLLKLAWHWLLKLGRHVRLSWLRLSVAEQGVLVLRLGLWGFAAWGLYWLLSQGLPEPGQASGKPPQETPLTKRLLEGVPWLGALVLAWGFLKDMMTQFGSPLKLDMVRLFTHSQHRDGVDDLHRFQEDFRRLLRTYVPRRRDGRPGRVVVFIDDLDRCEAPKAADVLQSLFQMLHIVEDRPANEKQAALSPGVICILGMDREKVAAAVAAKHEKLLPLLLKPQDDRKKAREQALDFGHTYLEKFIQLTLHLPAMRGSDRSTFLQAITGWDGKVPAPGSLPESSKAENHLASHPARSDQPSSPPVVPLQPVIKPAPEVQAAEQAAAQRRIRNVEEHLRDGHIAYQCASYVADALENNPRKLKQFVNLLRLRLFLAAAMKHLDDQTLRDGHDSVAEGKLSAHHIAKLAALEIACPREMNDLRMKLTENEDAADAVTGCAADDEPAIKAMLVHGAADSSAYDLAKAPICLYFHL